MSQTYSGHFDGKVIVLEKPAKLPVGKRLRIHVEVDQSDNLNASPGRKIIGTAQFCSGIADLGSNKKHLKGFGKK